MAGSGGQNGGSPWGGGGNNPSPWGKGGGSGGGPPSLDEVLRQVRERLGRLTGGGSGGRGSGGRGAGGAESGALKLAGLAVAVVFGIWLATGIYRVLPDEQGVVLRFGAFAGTTPPGLHYHLPSPVESVLTPKVTFVHRTDIGSLAESNRIGGGGEQLQEALMLTGDENIVDIHLSVFWVIKDARAYLFNIRDPEIIVKSVAESAVREIVGRTPIASVLAEGRRLVETDTEKLLQSVLDSYGAGVEITQIQLQKVDPPEQVIESFRDVQRARTDMETATNEAEAYHNNVVPRARGEAAQIEQEAEAYKQQIVAKAQGDAERFTSVLTAYRAAKDVTAERLYLDTMEQVLKNANKVIIDRAAAGVVPYLPLPPVTPDARTAK